jgi:hypothetical protein
MIPERRGVGDFWVVGDSPIEFSLYKEILFLPDHRDGALLENQVKCHSESRSVWKRIEVC